MDEQKRHKLHVTIRMRATPGGRRKTTAYSTKRDDDTGFNLMTCNNHRNGNASFCAEEHTTPVEKFREANTVHEADLAMMSMRSRSMNIIYDCSLALMTRNLLD
eukprot:scaffold23482_cov32-Tisochrysis_lutea.AAC.4